MLFFGVIFFLSIWGKEKFSDKASEDFLKLFLQTTLAGTTEKTKSIRFLGACWFQLFFYTFD